MFGPTPLEVVGVGVVLLIVLVGLAARPYKAPEEPRAIARRAAVVLFFFGVSAMILTLSGNEKYVFFLSIMLMGMGAAFAIEGQRYSK